MLEDFIEFPGISNKLRNEFDNLYRSLFDNPDRYEKVIIAHSSSWKGLGREGEKF
jgi:hypothetical protein